MEDRKLKIEIDIFLIIIQWHNLIGKICYMNGMIFFYINGTILSQWHDSLPQWHDHLIGTIPYLNGMFRYLNY